MFVLISDINSDLVDQATVVAEIKQVIANPDFIAFSHKNFNREPTEVIATLWATEEAANEGGVIHGTNFIVENLETSETYSRSDFLSDAGMIQIKTGLLSN